MFAWNVRIVENKIREATFQSEYHRKNNKRRPKSWLGIKLENNLKSLALKNWKTNEWNRGKSQKWPGPIQNREVNADNEKRQSGSSDQIPFKSRNYIIMNNTTDLQMFKEKKLG